MEAQVETPHFLAQPKEDNNQSKINKQPEVPENQIAWNSINQTIKETVNQTNQMSKTGGQKEPQQGGGLCSGTG